MSSIFPRSGSGLNWPSMSSTLRASSPSSPQADSRATAQETFAPSDAPLGQPAEENRLRNILSNGWSEYLRAQHTTRELSTVRQYVEEQVQQLRDSFEKLERYQASHQGLTAAAVTQCKSRCDELMSNFGDLKDLGDRFTRLQKDVGSSQEQITTSAFELGRRLAALQERVEGLNAQLSTDTRGIQSRYTTALELIEFLQRELREVRAANLASSQKLAALERQIETWQTAPPQLPQDMANFLNGIIPRQDALMKLLETSSLTPTINVATQAGEQTYLTTRSANSVLILITLIVKENTESIEVQRSSPNKQKGRRSRYQRTTKTLALSKIHSLSTLLVEFRERYRNEDPTSDVEYIWDFLNSLEEMGLSKHIQLSLAKQIPSHVEVRARIRKRYVRIFDTLTWEGFQGALSEVPPWPKR